VPASSLSQYSFIPCMDYVPSGCVPSFTGEENWGIVQSSVLKICYPIVPSYFGMCTGPAGGLLEAILIQGCLWVSRIWSWIFIHRQFYDWLVDRNAQWQAPGPCAPGPCRFVRCATSPWTVATTRWGHVLKTYIVCHCISEARCQGSFKTDVKSSNLTVSHLPYVAQPHCIDHLHHLPVRICFGNCEVWQRLTLFWHLP
jgi:hypothetical protein